MSIKSLKHLAIVTALSLLASSLPASAANVADGLQPNKTHQGGLQKTGAIGDPQINGHYGLFENIRSTFSRQAASPQVNDNANKKLWESLPLDKAIKRVKGNGKRHVAVFSDPNCGYCKHLETELANLDNVTVYTFMFPFLSPNSKAKASDMLCAKDPVAAWGDWMLHGKAAEKNEQCAPKVQELLDIGQRFGITGTPVMIFADGTRSNGFIRANAIEKNLK
ncbi:DsbC family protein [Glaciimonas sp. PCH181]|uniref:DsbC family protein n=1 Tax=Glaciimonas sp. PCH181 TaxID=2133943 RepID=UPI000D356E2C|nr:DsbC family protein [Glaciimonas sp. PCH181]PUA18833.1 thiol:disulfide interchange protein [Glaciimonas sp. PCH181]